MEGDKSGRQYLRGGSFHVDIARLRTSEGKFYVFVAIDRACTFAVAQLVEKMSLLPVDMRLSEES
ncbi:MAG: hypothetical protein ACK5II_05365 [Paracoccus sp. (in: a-proteobacteria)]